ncbi:hypothetical protein HZA56_17240 [Candidatus Poribacteria bacterium]|nr:hypothetical protein [Candidatus Poribacteria bacterium]
MKCETTNPVLTVLSNDTLQTTRKDVTKETLVREREFKNAVENMAKYRLPLQSVVNPKT